MPAPWERSNSHPPVRVQNSSLLFAKTSSWNNGRCTGDSIDYGSLCRHPNALHLYHSIIFGLYCIAKCKTSPVIPYLFPSEFELLWKMQLTMIVWLTNSPVTGWFPSQRASDADFYVLYVVDLNKMLKQQSMSWWLETQWPSCDVIVMWYIHVT